MTGLVYHHLVPDTLSQPWIDSLWRVHNPTDTPHPICVLPDGRVDIHFSTSPTEAFHCDLAGIDADPFSTEVPPQATICAVGFNLLAVEYIIQRPMARLTNMRLRLSDNFWGITQDDIQDFNQFTRKITTKLSEYSNIDADPRKIKMFEALYQHQGNISVSELADISHWSTRQINRYFNHWFGISLKTYSSILRFRASFAHIKSGNLYPQSEFSDQSHFIKEIKKFSGHTPKELHKNQNDRFIQLLVLK